MLLENILFLYFCDFEKSKVAEKATKVAEKATKVASKILFKDYFQHIFMVSYNCSFCQYSTSNKNNYTKHLNTKKHLLFLSQKKHQNEENEEKNEENEEKNEENEEKVASPNTNYNQNEIMCPQNDPQNICQFCSKKFSRNDNLKRHISVCKLNFKSKKILDNPRKSKNEEKSCQNNEFCCHYCQKSFTNQSNLTRHEKKCFEREKEILMIKSDYEQKLLVSQEEINTKNRLLEQQQKTIDLVQKMKPSVTNITNNTTNKTINYLNTNYGEMIAMDKFLYNLQHTEQLTQQEREQLLTAYKDSGIELFARSFSHVMKENCRRQLLKEGLPEMDIIPLYCSDGNLRSHKEKDSQGWKTHYDNNSLNSMINISSDQVYQSCRKPLMIFGKERNKVFKQIKQDNHAQKELGSQQLEDNKLVV